MCCFCSKEGYYYVVCDKFVCKLRKLLMVGECDGLHCNKLITIVNYYLGSCLICISIDPKASCLLIVNAAIVS